MPSSVACSSTAPPPTVPSVAPFSSTSILAPAPRGVEPELARMLQSTAPRPAFSSFNSVENRRSIETSSSLRQPAFSMELATNA